MYLVKPSFEIEHIYPHPSEAEKEIEKIGRVCYKSEDKITDESAHKFCDMILGRKHESVIEHSYLRVRFISNRGFTHELVRHRLASYSQESTRYCNYGKKGVRFIIPAWVTDIDEGQYDNMGDILKMGGPKEDTCVWCNHMLQTEISYLKLLDLGWTPQQARDVLAIGLKTEIVISTNFRMWRHILSLRDHDAAHPQMQELMKPLHAKLASSMPKFFGE